MGYLRPLYVKCEGVLLIIFIVVLMYAPIRGVHGQGKSYPEIQRSRNMMGTCMLVPIFITEYLPSFESYFVFLPYSIKAVLYCAFMFKPGFHMCSA